MNAQTLAAIMGCSAQRAELWAPHIDEAMARYDINTVARQASFLAQIGHESGCLGRVAESLNYRVDALLSLFGRHRISEEDARRFGRTEAQAANQEEIANRIYGGDYGRKNLGNTEPGDGWRFRGRGFGLTGRANYAACGEALGVDLIDKPELLETPKYAALSGGWFWDAKRLNSLADVGDFEAITKRINGGLIGQPERLALFEKAKAVLA